MSKILVIGASQGIGFQTTKEALNRGYAVRAMARSADKISLVDANLELRTGSALSEEDVTSALAGISCVILALGVPLGRKTITGPVRLFSQATATLLPAMENAGIKRLICITGYGAGDSRSGMNVLETIPFNIIFGRIYDDKSLQERMIENSRLDWVIARPGILTNGRKTPRYRVLVKPNQWRNGIVSRANVANFVVNQIESDDYIRQSPVLIN